MFNAESGNNEFVELYNAGSTPFDLSGYKIKYFWDYRDTIKALSQGMIIPPKTYAVILENDYDISTGIYKNIIPPEAIILVIDNTFGSGGMADGNTRYIDLLNNTNQLVQRYTYSPNNLTAHSDEIILRNRDTSASNWGNSISYNGSPGKANTIIKYYDELSLSSLYYPDDIIEGDFVKFNFVFKNYGVNNSSSFTLKVYNDVNNDSMPDFEVLIITKNFTSLSSADSIIYTDSIAALIGDNNIISILEYPPDENPTNNKTMMSYSVRVRNDFNELILNEVKYNPIDNEGEWIEIYNRTNKLINLRGWKLADNTQILTITNDSIIIYPHEYVVLKANLSLPNLYKYDFRTILANLPQLNNDGDAVLLKDDYNKVIDSMIYRVTNTSIKNSVERVNFDSSSINLNNWQYSIDRLTATPGRINSVTTKNIDLIVQSASTSSNYFLVDEPFRIIYTLHNYGFQNSSTSKLKLYNDINGDSVFSEIELLNEISVPDVYAGNNISGTIIAAGLKEGINSLKLLINYSFDNDSLNNDYYLTATGVKINEIKNDIVINEIMYAPINGESEWIELYNRSNKNINLKNYIIADLNFSNKIIDYDFILEPSKYLVISTDTTLVNYYPGLSFITSQFNPLNNSADNIIIRDSLNRTIDSVFYSESYGGLYGKSLERIDVNGLSIDKNNWKTSEHATPGAYNTVSTNHNNVSLLNVSIVEELSNIRIKADIINKGLNAANFKINIYEDKNLDSLPDNLIEQKDNSLTFNSSTQFISEAFDKNVKGYLISLAFPLDEDSSDNQKYILYNYNINNNNIVLNEVMLYNENGKSWVEFYNQSERTILINGKKLKVNDSEYLLDTNLILRPKEFITITNDNKLSPYGCIIFKNFSNLTNSKIVLYDSANVIDSLNTSFFRSNLTNRTYERVSSVSGTNSYLNWTKCLNERGSTINEVNSNIYVKPYTKDAVFINEVMFNPGVNDNEFIEIYKNSNENAVDISGWELHDANKYICDLSLTSKIIAPDSYYVISSDTLIFLKHKIGNINVNVVNKSLGLNNDGDVIIIKDAFGNVVDSLQYLGDWITPTTYKSIEKISSEGNNDKQNWRASVSITGGTPGYKNSIEHDVPAASTENLLISPNPFSPDEDGFEDLSYIIYKRDYIVDYINIKVFDSKGRMHNDINYNNLGSKMGQIIFEGKDEQGDYLKMGIYILLIEFHSAQNNFSEQFKKTIVVARKL